jgi:hypothetical protein
MSAGATWRHLAFTVLPDYFLNTLILCLGVGVGVTVVGVSSPSLVLPFADMFKQRCTQGYTSANPSVRIPCLSALDWRGPDNSAHPPD